MTAKLLPAFLECFEDSYVSVRTEVCIACTNLRIRDEQVLEKLVDLATFDPIWKVKALALQGRSSVELNFFKFLIILLSHVYFHGTVEYEFECDSLGGSTEL